MSIDLEHLRIKVAALKAAPLFQKAAMAERTMDALTVLLEEHELQIKHLRARIGFLTEGEKNG